MGEPTTDVQFQTLDEGSYDDTYSDVYEADTFQDSDADTVSATATVTVDATDVEVQ